MSKVFCTENERKYLVTDNTGVSGIMVFAYWADEVAAAKRRLHKAGRVLVAISPEKEGA